MNIVTICDSLLPWHIKAQSVEHIRRGTKCVAVSELLDQDLSSYNSVDRKVLAGTYTGMHWDHKRSKMRLIIPCTDTSRLGAPGSERL